MPIYRVTIQEEFTRTYAIYVDAPHEDAVEHWIVERHPHGTIISLELVGAAPLAFRLNDVAVRERRQIIPMHRQTADLHSPI